MRVTLFRDKFTRSWPPRGKPLRSVDRAYVIPLSVVLERDFATDAHFAAYHSSKPVRVNRDALEQGFAVEMSSVVFDVDCEDTHGTSEPAPTDWRRGQRERVCELFAVHPGGFLYETRGGLRLVYRLLAPFVVRTPADAVEWSQRYAVAVAYVARRFDIRADGACCDWQRCFRAPHATRTPGGQPENWPTWGDPANIGALAIQASSEDMLAAEGASNAFAKNRSVDLGAPGLVGDGLFCWLFRLRNDLGRPAPRGGWVVRCPNRQAHSTSTDGTDSTIVYPAAGGGELGLICCKHDHCQGLRAVDWLRFFSDYEIENARRAAGIPDRTRHG